MSGALGILLAFVICIILSLAIVASYERNAQRYRERETSRIADDIIAYRKARWKEIQKMMEGK